MEKAFRIESNAKYYIDIENYLQLVKNQKEQVKEFLQRHEIKATRYHVGGDGFVNKPFEEYDKGDIVLSIFPKDKDKDIFGKMLCKEDDNGLCDFRKRSKVNKAFQDYCIENKVVINLSEPDLRDYLKSMDWKGYRISLFNFENLWYLKVESDLLKDDDVPEGFVEIKLSEFYLIKDKYESEGK